MDIVDGAANFGAELATVYRLHPAFAGAAQRVGVVIPPLDRIATKAPPAVARINHNRLIADCPDCGGAVYVWRDGPYLLLCPDCWNGVIGGAWRILQVPDDLATIEAALRERPLPMTRNWVPSETVDDLRQEFATQGEV